jgi:hypothetical protein
MIQEGKLWVEIQSQEPIVGTQFTRVLRTALESTAHRPVRVGERLYYHAPVESSPWQEYLVVPSEWVVSKVISYAAAAPEAEFQEIQIVYCESQSLPDAEIKRLTYTTITPGAVEGSSSDRQAYRDFLQTEPSKRCVIRHL